MTEKTAVRKPFAVLLSLSVLLPQLLAPARLRAQIEEGPAAPQASFGPAAAGQSLGAPLQAVPAGFNQTLSDSFNGAALGAAAAEDAASRGLQSAAQKVQAAISEPGRTLSPRAPAASVRISPARRTTLAAASALAGAPQSAAQRAARKSRALAPPSRSSRSGRGLAARTVQKLQSLSSRLRASGDVLFDGARGILHPQNSLPENLEATLKQAGLTPVSRKAAKLKLPKGVKVIQPAADPIASIGRFHFSPPQASAAGKGPVALDVDLSAFNLDDAKSRAQAMAAVEKALGDLVDANPAAYGASNQFGAPSQDMWATSVAYAPALVGDASIYATFRQWKRGAQKDGTPYRAVVDGGVMRFHIKVFNGKPYVMAYSGGFASINPAILPARYTDDELKAIAAQQLSPSPAARRRNQRPRRSKKSPRRTEKRTARAPAAPEVTLISREIAALGQGSASPQWSVIDIFQGQDMLGNAAIVLVDVNTGTPYVLNPNGMRFKALLRLPPLPRSQVPNLSPRASQRQKLPQPSAAPAAESGGITGVVMARAELLTNGEDNDPVGPMPMPNAFVVNAANGDIVAITDENGRFSIPAKVVGGKAMKLKIGLSGVYSPVIDADKSDADLTVSLTAHPGQAASVLINPSSTDEHLIAAVNSYVHVYNHINWMKAGLAALGILDGRIDKAIVAIIANSTAMKGNAFFDPTTKTLNLMQSGSIQQRVRSKDGQVHLVSITFENTAKPTIMMHEDTHSLVGILAQGELTPEQEASPEYQYVRDLPEPIMGSDENEATADKGSMFNRNNPELGNGFIVSIKTSAGKSLPLPNPNDIRNGANKIPYTAFDPNDPQSDPHESGNTEMGTSWMTYQDLIPVLGAKKAAAAAFRHLLLPSLYLQPANAASALVHLIIDGLKADGTNMLEPLIRKHALQDHGLRLPSTQSPQSKVRGPKAPKRGSKPKKKKRS